ncbi:alpha/beta hydrolase-fold protein [uncultured Croceitalea sp.]|uniref:alpha/beta hydrolase n=1 Tax=uncultured Croceitalea sp. TaxID=1798908 RepID=UPI003305689A
MKNKIKITLIIIVTTIISVIITGLAIEYSIQNNKYGDEVIQTKIDSKEMGEERKVIVHLPESYKKDTAKKYPVLYILDGTSQDIHTAEKVDLLSKVKLFPEAIVVGIPNTSGNRSRDFTPHYMKIDIEDKGSDYGNGNKFLEFIENELVLFINKNYRTNGFQTISGNSRGGLFTLYALLEKPQLFNGYICYSPAFWREDILIAKKVEAFIDQNKLQNKFIYMSIGDSENEKMKNGFDTIVSILNRQQLDSIHFAYQETSNANHQTNSYQSTVYALKSLGEYLLSPPKYISLLE